MPYSDVFLALKLNSVSVFHFVFCHYWLLVAGCCLSSSMCSFFQIVDLPTITESYKTIDGKNFYKTADICQASILCLGTLLQME